MNKLRSLGKTHRHLWIPLVIYLAVVLGYFVYLDTHQIVIQEQVGEASVNFSASQEFIWSTTECYTVRWDVSGIHEIYLNDRGQIGQGEQELCYNEFNQPQLNVIFEDRTEATYQLEITLIYDLPQFWIIVGLSLILLQLPIFINTFNPITWLTKLKASLANQPITSATMMLTSFIYMILTLEFIPSFEMIEHSDSRYYLELSQNISVTSFLSWEAVRPPIVPILYSLSDQNRILIGTFKLLLHVFAWLSFAWSVATLMTSRLMKISSLVVLLGMALSVTIFHWWRVLLTESIALSVNILLISLIVWFVRYLAKEQRSILQQVVLALDLLIIIFIWLFLRDINFYGALASIGLIILVLLRFPAVHQQMSVFVLIVIIGTSIIAFAQNYRSILTERWRFPLTNVIVDRIIPNEDALAFFVNHGLPITDSLLTAEGTLEIYLDEDKFDDFHEWLDANGRRVYIAYLLSHPIESILEPIDQRDAILLINDDLRAYSRLTDVSPIQELLTNLLFIHGSHLYFLSLLAIQFSIGIAIRYGVDWRWLLSISLMWLIYPLGFIVWHGDSIEVERHSIQVAVYWRLGLWLLFLNALDKVITHKLTSK